MRAMPASQLSPDLASAARAAYADAVFSHGWVERLGCRGVAEYMGRPVLLTRAPGGLVALTFPDATGHSRVLVQVATEGMTAWMLVQQPTGTEMFDGDADLEDDAIAALMRLARKLAD